MLVSLILYQKAVPRRGDGSRSDMYLRASINVDTIMILGSFGRNGYGKGCHEDQEEGTGDLHCWRHLKVWVLACSLKLGACMIVNLKGLRAGEKRGTFVPVS